MLNEKRKAFNKDEYGFYLSLPYLYEKSKEKYPKGFGQMVRYSKELGFKPPKKQYEYLARSVLAMILEDINCE